MIKRAYLKDHKHRGVNIIEEKTHAPYGTCIFEVWHPSVVRLADAPKIFPTLRGAKKYIDHRLNAA